MSFDDLFREDRPSKTLQRTAARHGGSLPNSAHPAGVSAIFMALGKDGEGTLRERKEKHEQP